MKKSQFLANAQAKVKNESGFSLVETLVAMSISLILAGAITTVVIGSTTMIGAQQIDAVRNAEVNAVLYSFGNVIRDADTIKSGATGTSIIANLRTGNRCERHEYRLVADTKHSGRYALEHEVTAIVLPGNLSCKAVDKTLSSGSIEAQTKRTLASVETCESPEGVNAKRCGPELDNLGVGSRIIYYNTQGRIAPRLGDVGYLNGIIPECKIGSVALVLKVPSAQGGADTFTIARTQIAVLNNQRGLSTCE